MAGHARISELDGIRGIAVIMVLVRHYVYLSWDATSTAVPFLLKCLLSITWSGVELFFVLSGFLIGGILLDQRSSASFFRPFYIRRTSRILPPYILLFGSFFLMLALNVRNSHPGLNWVLDNALPAWSYLLFVQNYAMAFFGIFGAHWVAITWSLAVEEQFYLVAPFLIRFLNPKSFLRWIPPLIIAAPVARILLMVFTDNNQFISTYVLFRWDALFLGVLCAYAVREPAFIQWIKAKRDFAWLIFALLGAGIFILQMRHGSMSAFMAVAGYTWIAGVYALLIILTLYAPFKPVTAFFNMRWLRGMGIISYSVYLFHEASHGLWNGLLLGRAGHPLINNPQGMAVMFVSLASTILFSILSWRFFEEPILQFGRRLSKGFQARRPIRSREQELGVPAMQPCEQDACSCSRLP